MTYHAELTRAMALLAEQTNAIFMGQGVVYPSTSMSSTFRDVPSEKRLEMPVAEDMQMGLAIGMALGGLLPVCVFPRFNFLRCAMNQLANHLDRLPIYSEGGYRPKVIIRVAAPSIHPFYPQAQHDDDDTEALRHMLRTVAIVTLDRAEQIVPAYETAPAGDGSTLLVEYAHLYRDARASQLPHS